MIRDAVAQVALNPTMTALWKALAGVFRACPTEARRTLIETEVASTVPDAGLAGFYRATFLAYLADRPAQIERAGALALVALPVDANRLVAFFNLHWGLAILQPGGHEAFTTRLRQARLAEIQCLLGRQLQAGRARRNPAAFGRTGRTGRKVALVVPHLANANHPPTSMAIEQAALLAGQGLEVTLYACQELDIANASHYLGCGREVLAPSCDTAWLAARLPCGVTAQVADARLSLMRRWQDMLALIDANAPDMVMMVGLGSPLMFPLYASYPVLGLGVHALPPMAPLDAWLSADPAPPMAGPAAWHSGLPPAAAHYHPYRARRPDIGAPLARAELGVADDALLLVTVGARLADEIDGAWAAHMLALLDANPHAVWLLAGGTGAMPPALDQAAAGRILRVAHRPDIARVVSACDIYVNPPRVGGGLSAAEAMALGVPVVSLTDGDVGAKLGELGQPDIGRYFAYLAELMADRRLRLRDGRRQRALFDATIDLGASAPSLLEAFALAVRRFRARCVRPPAAS